MKRLIFSIGFILSIISQAWAQNGSLTSYLDEMQALGTVSGTAMACGSPKYETFEMLARAILITKAASDQVQEKGMKAFNSAKVEAFVSKQKNNLFDCDEINARFDKQKIFKTTLYRDGTIKMYDGKVFRPRHPYDATLLKEDENINRQNALSIYQKGSNKQNKTTTTANKQIVSKPIAQPQSIPAPQVSQTYSAPQQPQIRPTQNIEKSRVRHISNKNR